MDDSSRYLEGEALGKVVSGFLGRALDLLGGVWEARSKRRPEGLDTSLMRAPSRGDPRTPARAGQGSALVPAAWVFQPWASGGALSARLTQDWVAQQETGTSLFCFAALARGPGGGLGSEAAGE